MNKVELKLAHAIELKPDAKYLLVFDTDSFTQEDTVNLMDLFKKQGFTAIGGVMVKGGVDKMKLIEQKDNILR